MKTSAALDKDGFTLYRGSQNWRPYVIFPLPKPGDYEDAVTADINGDGWKDIVLGGWGNRTVWAENPAGHGKDPYTTPWTVHVVDTTRFSHEVCAAVLNKGGKMDIVTTSGVYLQGATPGRLEVREHRAGRAGNPGRRHAGERRTATGT